MPKPDPVKVKAALQHVSEYLETLGTNDTSTREAIARLSSRIDKERWTNALRSAIIDFRDPLFLATRERIWAGAHMPGKNCEETEKDFYYSSFMELNDALYPKEEKNVVVRGASQRKTVRNSPHNWEIGGESMVEAQVIPDPPQHSRPALIRITHSNSYGPADEAEFFVRVGNPDQPTRQNDLESGTDWIKAQLVEELITIDGKEMLRSEARDTAEDETPWEGTYEAQLEFRRGRHGIEIKILSQRPELLRSVVLNDWTVIVR